MRSKKISLLIAAVMLATVFTVVVPGSVSAEFAGGSGTAEDPYQISDVYQLQNMNNDLDAHYILINDIDASDTVNWNDGAGFWPIGTFTGVLNGNNFKISDLFINRPNAGSCGLFSHARNAEITNVFLENIVVIGLRNVGGLIGDNSGSTISLSSLEGSVYGRDWVGGLVGYNADGTIYDSHSEGSVSALYGYIGGIVGENYGRISNSYSTSSVTVLDPIPRPYPTGGFVGFNQWEISNSYATGSVSGYDYVGGFSGGNYGSITNSYSTGFVTGTNHVGGFCGLGLSTIVSSYWDTETSGQSISQGGIGKTTAQMKQQATYVDWDFTDIWSIEEGLTYPQLWFDFLVADAGPDQVGSVGASVTFDGSKSLDPDRNIVSYDWDFGDGNTGSGMKPSHIYDNHGIYTVTLTVANGVGETESDTCLAIVWYGAGSPGDPYQIYDLDQLQKMKYCLDGHYILMNDIDALDTFNWNGGEGFEPISRFVGGLHGNGYIISNLYINRPTKSDIGLFGNTYHSYISNVALENVDITGGGNVGGLAGSSEYGTISNSYVTGSVSGYDNVGGLVGSGGSISNSYASVTVSAISKYCGGLAGQSFDSITHSYSIGSVNGGSIIGGLVGLHGRRTISNCYSTCNVIGDSNVGGLVGRIESRTVHYYLAITDSFATGDVIGVIAVGGLVGWVEGWWHYETIVNSFATGSVSATEHFAGGLTGALFYGLISNSYSTGSVNSSGLYIGGFTGTNVDGLIYDCYSTGCVNSGGDYIGGFVGYNVGQISNSYSSGGTVGTGVYIGGFIGYNVGNYPLSSSYWDIDTSGMTQGVGYGPEDGIYGKTTKEMKQQTTFVGWDFMIVWNIKEHSSYPFHRWPNQDTIGEVQNLIDMVISMDLPYGIENGLLNRLYNALTALENDRPSVPGLITGFKNEVYALRGLYLSDEQADELIAIAQWVYNLLYLT